MTADEGTQTNGLPSKKEPAAGLIKKEEAQNQEWTVESGMLT